MSHVRRASAPHAPAEEGIDRRRINNDEVEAPRGFQRLGVGPWVTMYGSTVLIAGSGDAAGSGTAAPPASPAPPPLPALTFSSATTHGSASTAGVKSAPSPGGLNV